MLDVCDTMRIDEHYKIFGTEKSFRTKCLLFTLKFENGCLDEREVEKIKGFTAECRDLCYYAMCVTGSVDSKNLQMVLKVVTKAIYPASYIKSLYLPIVDEGIGTCILTVKAVPKKPTVLIPRIPIKTLGAPTVVSAAALPPVSMPTPTLPPLV